MRVIEDSERDGLDEHHGVAVGSRDAFVVFQGGGAKGISHIGAVGALADAKINVLGVAGTSAGAIVAALTAAGYTAEELLAIDGSGKHLLTTIDPKLTSPTHLFGGEGWHELMSLMALSGRDSAESEGDAGAADTDQSLPGDSQGKPKARILRNFGKWWLHQRWRLWLLFLVVVVFCDTFSEWILPRLPVRLTSALPSSVFAALGDLVVLAFVIVEARWIAKRAWKVGGGLSSTTKIREVINRAIVIKLKKDIGYQQASMWSNAEDDGITFAQFVEAGGLPLRIVATDVTNQTVRLFSAEDTPSVAVADAVCASIGLPIVFEVKGISMSSDAKSTKSMHFFLDGGLLSNLPLWVFDEDRSLNRNALTIGFALEQSAGSQSVVQVQEMPPFGWFLPAVESVVSGPQSIHHRAIEGLLLVSVPTGLDVLSFNRRNSTYCKEVSAARKAAREQLTFQLDFPAQLRGNLQDLRNMISGQLDKLVVGGGQIQGAVRQFGAVDSQAVSLDWKLTLSLVVQRPGYLRTLQVIASTDPEVTGYGRGGRVIPFSDLRLVWGDQDFIFDADVFNYAPPVLRPLGSHGVWRCAVPVKPAGRALDAAADAVILVVESSNEPNLQALGVDTDEVLQLAEWCLLAISREIEASVEAFGLAFMENFMQNERAEVQPKDHVVRKPLEFDEHVRRAQIWQ